MRGDLRVGVVITTCRGREENLRRTLAHLDAAEEQHPVEGVVVVYDGCRYGGEHDRLSMRAPYHPLEVPKHEPGMEQPRNAGVRQLRETAPQANYVWFVDSDVIFKPDILDAYARARLAAGVERVLIGPYEWMPQGREQVDESLRSDTRWASFDERGPDHVYLNDLGCGLGCFGGNIMWPIDAFEWVGGFHPDLHHGRCEDGELGLRAASAGVPMSMAREARGWHVWHPVNMELILQRNARDVPLLNSWHPEIQDKGFLLSEKDGARFDFRCTWPGCGLVMNSHDHWNHLSQHKLGQPFTYADPGSVRPA